ncbi:MAG: sulfite exporter TauE/SafE family protein [Xanthomonadales bacterium]|nr:putative membrane transporter protein [Xanthomonadales bacterium]MCC6593904.1 sulfite exporter TauE/SafE family protein [Xanthomonadales bacterium]MCE7932740.1 sulfite exporter TauE/SafE family protein [Xanthomonadales bacterium PRO6]
MWLALIGALAIGLSLGLLGSGGSILTVPVLVYLLGQPEKVAIAGSLLVVGTIALAGALQWALRDEVDGRSVLLFGLPGMAGTVLGASLATALSGPLQLTIFALVMLVAAQRMLRPAAAIPPAPVRKRRLAAQGFGVGLLTGVVGIGGGFLILPALVLLGGLSMHRAIGTSLSIISLNAYSGFARHWLALAATGVTLDWRVLGILSAVGCGGSLIGQQVASRLPQQQLKRAFGVLLVLMAAWILWRSAPSVFTS